MRSSGVGRRQRRTHRAATAPASTMHRFPNSEARLQALYGKLARHGTILVVADQPASIGTISVAAQQARRTPGGLPVRTGHAPHRRPAPRHIGDRRPRRLRRRQPGLTCRTGCDASTPARPPWPSWRCSSATTTTLRGRPPESPPASSAACSPRSSLRWRVSSAKIPAQQHWDCYHAPAPRPGTQGRTPHARHHRHPARPTH